MIVRIETIKTYLIKAEQEQTDNIIHAIAALQEGELARPGGVLDGLGEMGRQHDRMAPEQGAELAEGAGDQNVGVEIDEIGQLVTLEEILQQVSLHRRFGDR